MTEPYDHQRPPPPAATPPVPPAPPPAPAPEEPEEPEAPPRRSPAWVGLLTAMGLGLAAVMTAQVLTAIAEGMALKSTEPQGIKGDTFHRLGYAFGGLGGTAVLFLVVAVVLVSLPPILDAVTSDRHELMASIALGLTTVMAVVIAAGSILTVRYNLHLYSASHRSVPGFVRVQLIFFLLGALGTAAVALFGSVAALGLRDRRQQALAAASAEDVGGSEADESPLGDPTLPR